MACGNTFMDIARVARAKLYYSMGKAPETEEIPGVGENIKLDRDLKDYLTIYKGMTRKNVSTTAKNNCLIYIFSNLHGPVNKERFFSGL